MELTTKDFRFRSYEPELVPGGLAIKDFTHRCDYCHKTAVKQYAGGVHVCSDGECFSKAKVDVIDEAERRVSRSGIFSVANFSGVDPFGKSGEFKESHVNALLSADSNVILTGPTGTGKTTLMAHVVAMLSYYSLCSVRAYDFATLAEHCVSATVFSKIESSGGIDGVARKIACNTRDGILFIDDIREIQDFAFKKAIELIERLYAFDVTIWTTTNLDASALAGAVGSRVASRLSEDATIIKINSESYRKPRRIIEFD